MLVNRALAAVGVGDRLVNKAVIPGLLHIGNNAAHQPEGVVGAGVLNSVDDGAPVRGGNHRGRAEGGLLLLRLEPSRLKQVQAISLLGQGPQQLHQPAAALFRVGMGHHHGVLGGVPVAQAHSAPYLHEGGKPGEHDVNLALIQVPNVELCVHALVGGIHLEAAQLLVPEFCRPGKVLRHLFRRVLFPHGLSFGNATLAQQENQLGRLPRLQGQVLLEAAAVVAALFPASAAPAGLHRNGVALRAVGTQEGVPQALKAVRLKIGGKKLIALLFVIQIVLNHAVLTAASGGVEAHLEILIVHGNLVEAEFQIGKHRNLPGPVCIVSQV